MLGKKHGTFCPFLSIYASFYQDKLRTDMGKIPKKYRFSDSVNGQTMADWFVDEYMLGKSGAGCEIALASLSSLLILSSMLL